MAQFAPILVPFALQAASTAWQQYQQHEAVQRQQQERAAAAQAQAEAARREAAAQAAYTRQSAEGANRSAWQAHDAQALAIRRDTDADIAALRRDHDRAALEDAEALRRDNATRRARFAAAGLDAASGSASAVLLGLNQRAATQAERDRAAVNAGATDRRDAAEGRIADSWRSTAQTTQDRAWRAQMDIWRGQQNLDAEVNAMGVRTDAANRRDLLDLSVSHQRAALGLGTSTMASATRGLGGSR
jgi:hypothetical protein